MVRKIFLMTKLNYCTFLANSALSITTNRLGDQNDKF